MAKFAPTDEQQQAIDAFETGDDIVISAYAGSGKTSTLSLLSETVPQDQVVFIAYNRAIADDAAKSFPSNTVCRTAHSFAFRAIMGGRSAFADRLNAPRVYGRGLAIRLNIRAALEVADDHILAPGALARLVYDTVRNFCYSDSTEVEWNHVPYVNGADMKLLREYIMPIATRAWNDLSSPKGTLPWNKSHDLYLKMWCMSNPRLPGDAVFLDEAQDANPCIAGVVMRQRHAQKVMVGDSNQQIYAWRGAVDAMQNFNAKHHVKLTQSFRFGEAVAEEANKWLTLLGNDVPLRGFDKIPSKVVTPLMDADAVLCRTNATVIAEALEAIENHRKHAIVGGTEDIKRFAKAVMELQNGTEENPAYTEHPDLMSFKTWAQVKDFVQEEGGDLKILVKLIDTYGVEKVLMVADTAVDEKYADVILSTAHKAKGREWDKVKIAPDFTEPESQPDGTEGELSSAEMMLAYVAVTRAKLELDNSGLAWVDRWLTRYKELKDGPQDSKREG